MLMNIYNKLIENETIAAEATGRIKFYEFPPKESMTGVHIVIDPLDVPLPKDYADNKPLTRDYLYQIDVWSKDRNKTREVSEAVFDVMEEMNFRQRNGVDEYDPDFQIFREARRYNGRFYTKK